MLRDSAPLAVVAYFSEAHDGAGWYYYDAEYPEEGSCGAFEAREQAVSHAEQAGYNVECVP